MGQSYTTMSQPSTSQKGEPDADAAASLRESGVKPEIIDDSASSVSEGADLATAQYESITVVRKENAVNDSILFLGKVEGIVAGHTAMFPEFKTWQDQTKQILNGIKSPRVLVGVLGYTGSGKSSLINALIDEEMVVPANAMRASTSVVTEISWNDSDDPEKAFRAEIEFISETEWKEEMDVLLDDLKNATKGEDVSVKSGSQASTAFAKISAVWPGVTLSKLKGMTSQELFDQIDGVSNILDCHLEIAKPKAKPFSREISKYIDSNNKQKSSNEISYWPLVRCVRIYTKAEILRHGLVLVDLPGLGDSNTGRTQVAENYSKRLTYVWIVADIVRAIDDQVAKDLMGKSFRRQLLMDGKYDDKYVTFIMTKTDIINNEEVIESLQLREKNLKDILGREADILKDIQDGQQALARKSLKLKKIKRALKLLSSNAESTKADSSAPRKRKHSKEDRRGDGDQPSGDSKPMDMDVPSKRLLTKKKAHNAKAIKMLGKRLTGLKLILKSIRNDIKAACTQARSRYTQEHLRMDFENGLRELKQDISDDANDEKQLGNEDEAESKHLVYRRGLTEQLQIFCVSSKGYQRLCGRFKRDPLPNGFGTIKDTCIPKLQEYAAASTLTVRGKIADSFLTESNLLKLSIKSWAENVSPNSLSASQTDKLNEMLGEKLETLHKTFSHALTVAISRIREIIMTEILPTLRSCIRVSTEKAEEACKELMNADTSYQTWKAICRRFGKFNNKKNATYDWIGVFLQPFWGELAQPWDKVFNSQMQSVHDRYAWNLVRAIRVFSTDIRPLLQSMSEASASKSPIDFLAKIPYLEKRTRTAVSGSLSSAQRQAQEIHRLIEPRIQHHMRPVYEKCSQESKIGALGRMKEHLLDHIKKNNKVMYNDSSDLLNTRLNKMTTNLEELLKEAHSQTSHYLRTEIRNMIMWAIAKDDETRENVRKTIRKELTIQLDTLEVALGRGTSKPTDRFLSVRTETKPDDDSSEDNDEDDDISDDSDSSDNSDVGDNSDGSEEAESTGDGMEDS
ncbi:hypothetical protein BCIN_04g06800 [Botrytis cinerea B05.10]|uniref:Tat pathway signal sequence protein n=2 Tax=Botryotinia fuckeliana (strain B05.10) TaxID=332648 RepID=A0A384JG33_BOTFB|nr:hypothetical protein BCIN_04g06800 [Botrytis cinerea B05.10]ATZ49548.1 hypothetical protein BCIN_04g06800 [Botrytis cinerea B05.10]